MRSVPSSSEKKRDENKNKLSHQGFRLEEHVIKNLAEEAVRNGISVSSLVNKILKNYVTHEMQFEELGFMLVSKDFLRKIFSVIDDEKHIHDFGKEFGTTMAKEYVSYFYPQLIAILWFNFWIIGSEGFNHVSIWSKIATEAKTLLYSQS